jgi:hypothetical protein
MSRGGIGKPFGTLKLLAIGTPNEARLPLVVSC